MSHSLATPQLQPVSRAWDASGDKAPRLLHEFLDQAAARWPERVAIEVPPSPSRSERQQTTYTQLQGQADALADFLRAFVVEECVVAILLPRIGPHLYAAQLGVMKAGAAYTCIDPAFPDEQLERILADAQPMAILTDSAGWARARRVRPDAECVLDAVTWLDQHRDPPAPPPPAPWLTPRSLAYVIYTSGTTGRPKGVMIEHGTIASLVQGDLDTLGVLPTDRVGQNSSSAYDSSVEETWFALAAGATLVVMDDETIRLGPDLIDWLRRERITMFCPSPTLLRSTGCDRPEHDLPDLRLVHVGGEVLPADLAERWARRRQLINDYGPTECTVTCLRGRIEPGQAVTIGRPVPGVGAWVLTEALEEVPAGEPGELCISGHLARGYMHQPELTAQRFPHHPRLGRIYRTGDLVRREADGRFYCLGRIDAQVKVRGYRIELEAIEACLLECAGVRAAACRVQGDDTQQKIVAFLVPEHNDAPPCFDDLKRVLRQRLPEYMVPSRFAMIANLPTTASGKLNRRALPAHEGHAPETNGHRSLPHNPLEQKLALAFRATLGVYEAVGVDRDFFHDLGGDSLLAAQLVSRLRNDPATASLTVRDLYETRTVAELARRLAFKSESSATAALAGASGSEKPVPEPHRLGRPFAATIIQLAWLVAGLMAGAPIAYLAVFELLPWATETLGLIPLLLLAPAFFGAGIAAYATLTVALAVLAKKVLIGRYHPRREPVWGSFYVRNWMVQRVVALVPWRLLEGTFSQQMALRALGAKIGRRVHIHRGVNLVQGGWDLLDIGDDVTLSQDAALQLVELEHGHVIVGPVTLGDRSTLDVRAGVAGHTCVEADGYLTALSYLQRGSRIGRGERWNGIPAQHAGAAPDRAGLPERRPDLSPAAYGAALLLARIGLAAFIALPVEALAFAFVLIHGTNAEAAAEWLAQPTLEPAGLALAAALVLLAVPLNLIFELIAMRLLGRVSPGVIGRWSWAYVRVWLKAGLVESANRWLSGTLLWPIWLRVAGMKVGKGCELSAILDTIPELVEIGPASFLADGIYLGGPRVHRGMVTLARVTIGANTYFGNNVLIAGGQAIPDGVLLGVNTVADDTKLRPGTSWFGHPPFELPRREVVACDRRLTTAPGWLAYGNRVLWELLRFALPLLPFVILLAWLGVVASASANLSVALLLLGVVPVLDFAAVAVVCVFGLVLKWALLGRVQPGVHPLWSCWCRRWEFHYTTWDLYVSGPLSALEGTLLLNLFLRAMGTRIGRRVVLGPGYASIIDHDMLAFDDDVAASCMFQAHTFEDRVLKIDRVTIRADASVGNAAVLLYGADIGEGTLVMPHSVVMKHERLLPHRTYAGCPTHLTP
jgi:non-ribosomal peptide synthetase-like protein